MQSKSLLSHLPVTSLSMHASARRGAAAQWFGGRAFLAEESSQRCEGCTAPLAIGAVFASATDRVRFAGKAECALGTKRSARGCSANLLAPLSLAPVSYKKMCRDG